MRLVSSSVALSLLILPVLAQPARAASVGVFTFDSPVVTRDLATVDIRLDYQGVDDQRLSWIWIDVSPSASALSPGDDYSALSFTPAPLGDEWGQVSVFGPSGGSAAVLREAPGGPDGQLPDGSYLLGTLAVDLASLSLSGGSSVGLSLQTVDVLGAEVPGDFTSFELHDAQTEPERWVINVPTFQGQAIPEPLTALTSVGALASVGAYLRRRR